MQPSRDKPGYGGPQGLELQNSIRSVTNKDLVNSWLRSYLEEGGFPETIGEELSIRRTLLRGYVDSVILRDIVERYGVGNISFLRYLIQSLLSNAGQLFSTNKFHNDCKSQVFSIARSTAYDYLEYIEDAYLCFTVYLYTDSIRKRNTNPRKIYAIDQGIVKHYSLRANWGALFENLVYLDLRRAGYQVWYYKTKSGFEVDFVCEDPIGARRVIQVAYDIQDKNTLERDERALNEARIELNCPGDLVTLECYHSFIQSLYGNSGSNVP